jgi:hypothetical protein
MPTTPNWRAAFTTSGFTSAEKSVIDYPQMAASKEKVRPLF